MHSPDWLPVALGFGLGIKHALEPDHLVAVSTLMRGESRVGRLMGLGAFWGAGHLSTVAVGVTLLTGLRMTLDNHFMKWFETPVALMLIGLGTWTLLAASRSLSFSGSPTRHVHTAAANASRPRSGWWSYAVGSVHGLAGSGALVVFVAATFPDIRVGLLYVLLFGMGSMAGMALITSTLALPLRAMQSRPALYRSVTAVSGALSVWLGVMIVIDLVSPHF